MTRVRPFCSHQPFIHLSQVFFCSRHNCSLSSPTAFLSLPVIPQKPHVALISSPRCLFSAVSVVFVVVVLSLHLLVTKEVAPPASRVVHLVGCPGTLHPPHFPFVEQAVELVAHPSELPAVFLCCPQSGGSRLGPYSEWSAVGGRTGLVCPELLVSGDGGSVGLRVQPDSTGW